MRRIIRDKGIEKNVNDVNDVVNIFFGLKKGKLPEKFKDLHEQYLKELEYRGGCSGCRKNAIQKKYRNNILQNS
jgi:hypothetical protein|tara:strand:+ start:5022 stop:5243 length:222 start_codon:yes stop_codon:yes gene_type:complete